MIDIFSFLPTDNFSLLPYLLCWYFALFITGIIFIFYARFHALQKDVRRIYLSASTVFFLIGLSGLLLIVFRFNKTSFLSMQALHFIHIPILLWYIFRMKGKIIYAKKVFERSVRNKTEKDLVMKNTDPYLAAHRKKRKN